MLCAMVKVDLERLILSLPVKLVGIGIVDLIKIQFWIWNIVKNNWKAVQWCKTSKRPNKRRSHRASTSRKKNNTWLPQLARSNTSQQHEFSGDQSKWYRTVWCFNLVVITSSSKRGFQNYKSVSNMERPQSTWQLIVFIVVALMSITHWHAKRVVSCRWGTMSFAISRLTFFQQSANTYAKSRDCTTATSTS